MTTIDGAERWSRGYDLAPFVQEQAKNTFVHRYTGEHQPRWALKSWKDGRAYPVHFKDDAEWLANTLFAVTLAGHLDRRFGHCQSFPTWPNDPELRKPYGAGLQHVPLSGPRPHLGASQIAAA